MLSLHCKSKQKNMETIAKTETKQLTFLESIVVGLTKKEISGGRTLFVDDNGKKLEIVGGKIRNMGMLQAGWHFKLSGGDRGQILSVDETKAVVKMGHGITSISPRSEVEILDPEKITAEVASTESTEPTESTEQQKEKKGYEFNGKTGLSKGQLAREIVAKFVSENPKMSIKQLEDKFPAPFMGKFGLFKKLDEARAINGAGSDRYFFKDEQLITVGKEKIAVCNQMTSDKLDKVIELANANGMNITV